MADSRDGKWDILIYDHRDYHQVVIDCSTHTRSEVNTLVEVIKSLVNNRSSLAGRPRSSIVVTAAPHKAGDRFVPFKEALLWALE